jgi:hypothetical protein
VGPAGANLSRNRMHSSSENGPSTGSSTMIGKSVIPHLGDGAPRSSSSTGQAFARSRSAGEPRPVAPA